MRSHPMLTAVLFAALMLGALASSASARPFVTGFADDVYDFNDGRSGGDENRTYWRDRTVALGGDVVRILVRWSEVAPGDTAPTNPQDPEDPKYRWQATDAAVAKAREAGLDVLLVPTSAPPWAVGDGAPKWAPWGTWKPDPSAFGRFAQALALRYSGGHNDPDTPEGTLPDVDRWEVWNEPNLVNHLSPQWTGKNCTSRNPDGCKPFSPNHYRKMLNAAYPALTNDAGDTVVSAGLTAYGDPSPGCCGSPPAQSRIPPARFVRELLSQATFLDGLAQHVYHRAGAPSERALNRDDVQIPDISDKLRKPLNRAAAEGRALPVSSTPKLIWVTELGWESDADGVSLATQARYLQEGFYRLWVEGVELATWFRIVDGPAGSTFDAMGIHRRDRSSKPAAAAFRFMFVTDRIANGQIRYWGRAPGATPSETPITVERLRSGTWEPFASARTDSYRIFTGTKQLPAGNHRLRAVTDSGGTSPIWVQR